ncbi:kinase-like protein [Dendrothele bispora CBS 962.96]|uniref:Kinase-like protein n=1 Tax=Dendrothele bispora (strain CBS 962.96) TaxID=1314807 RepID=A0A4S8MQF6_DENBC|nr:kinase-like protein [Dendrothele bispora CBS 962.96]
MSFDGDEIPPVIGNWWLEEMLGSGYSGFIYRARHLHTRQLVALKVQHVDHECPTNLYEQGFYPYLQGGEGMPTLYAAGIEGVWNYLAIDLLGPSLETLFRRSGKETMDLRSVCCIAMQVIARLEVMHTRGILHRDIQLGNCVIGLPPNEKKIYMIDFGFSKRYIQAGRHIPDSKAKRDFIGNYWFSSVGVHCRGKVPSRRDDMEALALMLIHLLTPRGLSWTRNGVPKTDAAHDIVKRAKQSARPEDLCQGLPVEFEDFLRYCRRLKFKDAPDYEQWIEEFRELAIAHGYPDSDDLVWPPPTEQVSCNRRRPGSTAPPPDELDRILHDLGQLQLEPQPVLGDRTNIEQAVRNARQKAHEPDSDRQVITISSSSEGSDDDTIPPRFVGKKAYKISKLTSKLPDAIDNQALSSLVTEFVAVMKSNTSRTLTKDGSGFLDALVKQLADPSVFAVPMRTRLKDDQGSADHANAKLGVVARLRREVGSARTNGRLAQMVQDFGNVTNRSSGRTITKDGFAFLEGLARRLEELK